MSTMRYKPILDLTVSYKSIWVIVGAAVTLGVAGLFTWQRFQPATPDERAKQALSKAERFSSRADSCVTESVGGDLLSKLREGQELLKDARMALDDGDYAGTEEAAHMARDFFREFNEATCATATSVADFVDFKGRIEVKKQKSPKWVQATPSTRLLPGDRVRAVSGQATFRYKNGEQMIVRRGSIVEVVAYVPKTDGRGQATTRWDGSGEGVTAGGRPATDSTLEIPAGKVNLNADTVSVSRTDAGDLRTRSEGGGGATVVVGGNSQDLEQGTELVTRKAAGGGWEPGTVQAYLGAPELIRPVKGRVFTSLNPAKVLTILGWRPVEDATSYRVQLGINEYMDPVLNKGSEKVPVGNPEVIDEAEILGLPSGTYFWTVTAISAQGEAGAKSSVRKFTVQQGEADPNAVKPNLSVTKALKIGEKVLVEGKTDPYVRLEVFVNDEYWDDIPLEEDGSFKDMIPFVAEGVNVFRLEAQNTLGTKAVEEFERVYSY